MSEFDDLVERLFALHTQRRFKEMGGLLDGAVVRFPNRRNRIMAGSLPKTRPGSGSGTSVLTVSVLANIRGSGGSAFP